MTKKWLTLIASLIPLVVAADESISISQAAFAYPDAIAENIRNECNLPAHQTESVQKSLEAARIQVVLVEGDTVPATGRYVQLRVTSAVSAGNAFMGHLKQVSTSAVLFENGQEIAQKTFMRNSKGGFGAGFKGSCEVLQRCTDTIGKDITKWLRTQVKAQDKK